MRDDLQRPEVIAALQSAAQKKGIKDVAAEMDMAPSSLYSCLNPYGDRSSSKCGLELAIALMKYTGDKSALAIMAGELGCSVIERKEPDKPTVAEESVQDFAAVSALAQAMQEKRSAAVIHRLAMEAHSELEQTVSRYLDGWK
jgi:hypothetical protein